MRPHLAALLPALALLLLLVTPAPAQEVDGHVTLGSSFQGSILSNADVDVLLFDALAGELLTVIGAPKKSSVVLRVDLFYVPTATLITSATATPKKVSLKNHEIPLTGLYALTISGADGTTGAYKLKTKGKPAKSNLKPASEPGGGGATAGFDARAGSLLSATIKADKGSDAIPGAVVLAGPDGPIDVTPYTTVTPKAVKLKKVPLDAFGAWTLTATSAADAGDLKIKAKVKPPKLAKKKIIEPKGPPNPDVIIVLDPSIPLVTTSNSKKMTLLGEVVDLFGAGLPEELEWATSGGASGTIDVDSDGSFSGQATLDAGENVVTLSVPNTDVELDVLVTHNPGYTFGGLLDVAPDILYVGEPRTITARIALLDNKTDPDDVTLVRVDGGATSTLAQLKDDGDLSVGDEIEGDGIFTAVFDVTATSTGLQTWQVVVGTTGADAVSEPFEMLVDEHLSPADVGLLQATQTSAQALLDQAAVQGTVEQTVDAIVAQLENTPGITDVGESKSGLGVWVVYDSGMAGVMYAPADGVRSGGGLETPEDGGGPGAVSTSTRASKDPVVKAPPTLSKPYSAFLSLPSADDGTIHALEPGPQDVVQSNKALGIASYKYEFQGDDEVEPVTDLLKDDGCFEADVHQVFVKEHGDIGWYKAMGEYGVIVVSTHGDSFFADDEAEWQHILGWDKVIGEEILLTNDFVKDYDEYIAIEDDIKKGRIIMRGDGEMCVTSTFVRHYAGNLPNSLVYIGACRSAWNGSLAHAFLSVGAGAYLGYTDYVDADFAASTAYWFFVPMVTEGKTVGEAFVPKKEEDNDPAAYVLFGSSGLQLDATGVKDASFETGDLNVAWQTHGDARVVPGLDKYGAKDGGLTAIISTGLGFTTDSGSFSQQFCMPDDGTAVEFWWNFFSEEFTEFCGSTFQDSFTVTIADVEAPLATTTLFHTFIDALCGNVSPVDIHFDQPDDPETPGVFATGWRKTVAPVPAELQGKLVTITFSCTDVGDSAWDTAVLVDAISVKE